MLKVSAGHTAASVAGLRAATQALVIAALALEGTPSVLTVVHTHYEKTKEKTKK